MFAVKRRGARRASNFTLQSLNQVKIGWQPAFVFDLAESSVSDRITGFGISVGPLLVEGDLKIV
jgi:hypothetical protein